MKKLLILTITIILSFYSNAQHIYFGVRSGPTLSFNKFVPNGEISPFFYSMPFGRLSYTAYIGYRTAKGLCYEAGYAHLNQGLSIWYNNYDIHATSPEYKTYLISVGKKISFNRDKLNFQWMTGLNLNNINKKHDNTFSFPPVSNSLGIIYYKQHNRQGLWPGIHIKLKMNYELPRSNISLEFMGNYGFFTHTYSYYKANFENGSYFGTVLRKGDLISLMVGYSYKIYFKNIKKTER